MKLYKIYFYEYDMVNGEYIDRDTFGQIVKVKDEDALLKYIENKIIKIISDARKRGWDCDIVESTRAICYKDTYEHEIGYDYEEAT